MDIQEWEKISNREQFEGLIVKHRSGQMAMVEYKEDTKFSANWNKTINVFHTKTLESDQWYLFDIVEVDCLILYPDFEKQTMCMDTVCLYKESVEG